MRKPLLTLLFLLGLTLAYTQSLREIYQAGVKAYEQQDYVLFKQKMKTIDSLRPNYPPVIYNLAGASSLLKDSTSSLSYLRQYVKMNATQSLEEDADFAWVSTLKSYQNVKQLQSELSAIIDFESTFQLDLQKDHVESITYDKKKKNYYLGAVRDGSIWKLKEDGSLSRWNQPAPNAWSVMGLELSKNGRILWACTSAMENYAALQEGDKGKVSVLKYNVKNGKLLETFALPADHTFGDLISDNEGNIYISDGTQNKIYWISKKTGILELYVDFKELAFNLQGLTYSRELNAFFVSDYIDGIYKVENQEIKKLGLANDIQIKGIDGLYFYKNKLIGLHNGTIPNRIVCYTLNEDGNKIVAEEILAQAGMLGEPTQGFILGNKFIFIANSPWESYDREGNFAPEEDSELVIGEITLKK